MVEPTESESKAELDRFCEAMISIRSEIEEIELGLVDKELNVLKQAPHTAENGYFKIRGTFPYSRDKAVFPASWSRNSKVLAFRAPAQRCIWGSKPGVFVPSHPFLCRDYRSPNCDFLIKLCSLARMRAKT